MRRLNRRAFLKGIAGSAAGLGVGAGSLAAGEWDGYTRVRPKARSAEAGWRRLLAESPESFPRILSPGDQGAVVTAESPYGSLLAGPGDLFESADAASRIVLLHTNDTHSRMDPFPADGGSFAGLGGAARRATLIRRIREENDHVLLLDSGDIFQGTPYFNFFKGEVEFKAMTAMGYDVATLGNHDFDNGVDGLVEMLPEAGFQFVSANYDIAGSALEGHVDPFTIRDLGGVKVGIFGLGIAFERLVLAELHAGVSYNDPVAAARTTARLLRESGCSLVICLSHLGYRYQSSRPSDSALAEAVPEIDVILGGHTHTFMDDPDVYGQGSTGFTVVNQVGFAGMRLGRVDVSFNPAGSATNWAAGSYQVDGRLGD